MVQKQRRGSLQKTYNKNKFIFLVHIAKSRIWKRILKRNLNTKSVIKWNISLSAYKNDNYMFKFCQVYFYV